MSSSRGTAQIDLPAFEQQYREIAPAAERFRVELVSQLNHLLDDNGIALGFPIQSRVKKWDSLAEKFERVEFAVKNVKDVQDIVGLRVILQFRRDVSRVKELISKNLAVVRQYDTQDRMKEDQFGYVSVHFVVRVPETWLAVPTLADIGDLKAEIQVRTLAQHIWAEASQKLQYKHEDNVPPSVRRSIYRVSALLETVDLEFERVLAERESYRTSLKPQARQEPLNVDLLEKTLDSLLPSKSKTKGEHYAELLADLAYLGINTNQDLEQLIRQQSAKALAADSREVEKISARMAKAPGGGGEALRERIRNGVFLSHVGLVKQMLRLQYPEKYPKYLNETGRQRNRD